MKVIKIDIQKTIIEAPDNTQQLKYMTSSNLIGFIDMKKIPDGPMFTERFYTIRKLISPDRVPYYYAVHEDDTRSFNDLVQVSNQYIVDKINEGIKQLELKFNQEVVPQIIHKTQEDLKQEIKSLSWIKRLINNF